MTRDELNGQIFIGIIEDNEDPKKLGRCKVRVLNIFDDIPVEDIPWATPWKDLNGNSIILPDKGKVVSVVFDEGNPYKPEYIFAEHYNINLENKLKSLSGTDYTSMRALMFDHKTQIYSNDSEGLKLDYKYNNINITEGSINLNIKDNNGLVNIGDSTAAQQSILGNNFLDWFDEFVDNLMGAKGGPYLGNLSAPVVANPALLEVLNKYKALKNPQFLSHHVNIVDNSKVSTVRLASRENNGQIGDNWRSTVKVNDSVSKDANGYAPKEGPKQEYDPTYTPPSTDGGGDSVNSSNVVPPSTPLSGQTSNTKIDKLIRFMQSKKYVVYDKPNIINMVGLRTKDNGQVTNKFDDTMCVFYKNSNGNWELMEYTITTTPGYKPKTTTLPDKVAVLQLGQYVDQYKIGLHQNKPGYTALKFATSIVHRNDKSNQYNYAASTAKGGFGINIHHSSPSGSSESVFNWSEGCQVFKNINQYNQFIGLCQNQVSKGNKSTFTYTLCRKSEFDAFS